MRPVVLVVAVCAGALALALSGCGTGGYTSEGSQGAGKELFLQSCGGCHALADAGTTEHDRAQSRRRVRTGTRGGNDVGDVHAGRREPDPVPDRGPGDRGARYARARSDAPLCDDVEGDAFCVEDQDQAIADIAAYVGAVAGTGITTERPTDGKSIFTANCGSCHTLADAGTSGAVGPNLDESRPSAELVVDRVTNGQGAMPSFKDSLDADQIQAVADYVAGAAGK